MKAQINSQLAIIPANRLQSNEETKTIHLYRNRLIARLDRFIHQL